MLIDRPFFFQSIRDHLFHDFDQSQVDGLNHLLDVWEATYGRYPLCDLAYALATCFHETGKAMAPVREGGRGATHAYGVPTGSWHQVYYGRGDVQITWLTNYQKASAKLAAIGIIVDLAQYPDKALDPVIAAHIMFLGMAQGWFTGKNFANYLPHDPVNARRIINGTDRAQTITSYYTAFLASLRIDATAVSPPVVAGAAIARPTVSPTIVAQAPVQGFWSRLHAALSRKS